MTSETFSCFRAKPFKRYVFNFGDFVYFVMRTRTYWGADFG